MSESASLFENGVPTSDGNAISDKHGKWHDMLMTLRHYAQRRFVQNTRNSLLNSKILIIQKCYYFIGNMCILAR